ncbi:type II secretion system minor pseudopilin GspJ [Brevundimonas sp.]|uniref:type II secretion system minor pseudopilin GspJ n=1 Tax=Brevundimonas sp. TaxID=1871086 RepID=UPI002C6887BC|nr:type II secretion system minor pseudopilin GspJ [Brevundimonas sp.]HWQ87018.1 type II secretion system minor pseudopilin GspJ [Brevundimonas sp.]
MTRRAGFTLVEVLVSLMIFAMIAAAGAAVLGVTIDNRFAVKAASDRVGDLQRMRGLLRADLGQATARRSRGPTGRPTPQPMVGAAEPGDPILVLTRAGWSNPGDQARPSLQRVEYRLVEDRLERRVSSHLDGARPGPSQVLYRGVRDVTVGFVRDGETAPAFISSIDRPLPDAVRIGMTVEGYGRIDQLFLVGSGR